MRQFADEPNRGALEEFIREPDQRTLYIYVEGSDKIVVTAAPEMKKKGVFLLKSKRVSDALRVEDIKADVCLCECTENILQNLSLVAHEVFFPLLANPANRAGWSGPTAKDVMMKVSSFLSSVTITVGQSKGQTLLPLPAPEAFDEEALQPKERVHLLETAVIQWAGKIEQLLNSDSEQIVRHNAQLSLQVEKEAEADKKRKADEAAASQQSSAATSLLIRRQTMPTRRLRRRRPPRPTWRRRKPTCSTSPARSSSWTSGPTSRRTCNPCCSS